MFDRLGARRSVRKVAVAACLFGASPLSSVVAQDGGGPPELADGEAWVQARDWERAESWFYDFTKANPDVAQAWRRLAYVEIHRPGGDSVRARQYLDRALELEPDEPLGLVLSARLYQIEREFDRAAEVYDRVIEAGPGERDPVRSSALHVSHFNRAIVSLELGDPEGAKPHFERVLSRQPRQAYALFEEAMLARNSGDLEAAVELLTKAKEGLGYWAPVELWAFPQHRYNNIRDNIDFELGRALVELDRFDEARVVLAPLADIVRLRSQSPPERKRAPERSLLERYEDDVRFENAPYYFAEALAGAGEVKSAISVFKEFSRMRVGESDLHSAAKARAKELR